MEKIRVAAERFDDLRAEIATIKAVSCTLQESMANDAGEINSEYTMRLHGLREGLDTFVAKYMEIVALLLDDLNMKAVEGRQHDGTIVNS